MANDVKSCENRGECFASDPEALHFVQFDGDMGILRNNQALINGAAEAARQGAAFEDATYRPVSFVAMAWGIEGAERRILDVEGDADGELQIRAARCAFACGSSTAGQCPFITE